MKDQALFQSATMDLLSKLEAKKAGLQSEFQKRLSAVDKEIEAVSTTLRLLREPSHLEISVADSLVLADSVPMSALKNKSAREALVEIARRNGGLVRITEAKPLLLGAGILRRTKNSWGMIYTTLVRSKEFEKHPTESGTFRLRDQGGQAALVLQ